MKSLVKIVSIAFFGSLISVLLFVLLIGPVLSDVTKINVEAKDKKNELATLLQQIRAFKTAQADLAKATRKEDIFNAIVTKEDLVLPVRDLELAATSTNTAHSLVINEQTTKDKPLLTKKPGISEVFYTVNTVNDFAGTVNFIKYMEHLPHFTEISKIALSAESTTTTEGGLIYSGTVFGDIKGVFFINIKPK